MECLVLYEGWQMECCGIPFSNGSIIKWLVVDGSNIKLPIEIPKIDYYYENHDPNYEKISILEGNVKYIKALYQNYK